MKLFRPLFGFFVVAAFVISLTIACQDDKPSELTALAGRWEEQNVNVYDERSTYTIITYYCDYTFELITTIVNDSTSKYNSPCFEADSYKEYVKGVYKWNKDDATISMQGVYFRDKMFTDTATNDLGSPCNYHAGNYEHVFTYNYADGYLYMDYYNSERSTILTMAMNGKPTNCY